MKPPKIITYANEPEPGGFINNLEMVAYDAPIGERPYELISPLRYFSKLAGGIIEVPASFRTDLASVPRIFWRLLPPFGRYQRAAVLHDWLCELQGRTGIDYKLAARIFREAMLIAGVPGWKVMLIYRAVLWFGPRFKALTS